MQAHKFCLWIFTDSSLLSLMLCVCTAWDSTNQTISGQWVTGHNFYCFVLPLLIHIGASKQKKTPPIQPQVHPQASAAPNGHKEQIHNHPVCTQIISPALVVWIFKTTFSISLFSSVPLCFSRSSLSFVVKHGIHSYIKGKLKASQPT